MLAPMYRDESEATRLRIETLEAKLAERDAMLAARDAEINELSSRVERLDPASAAPAKPQRLAPILLGAMTLLLATSSAISLGMRPRAGGCATRHAVEARTTTTGIAACDEYLFRLQLCISRLDPAVRDSMSTSLRTTREAWWTAGATPGGREKLGATCEQALDGLAVSPLCD
jgi:hypothetical protein